MFTCLLCSFRAFVVINMKATEFKLIGWTDKNMEVCFMWVFVPLKTLMYTDFLLGGGVLLISGWRYFHPEM